MKKNYKVLQGVFTKGGDGDWHLEKEFTSLKEAKKYFNEIKKDDRGWVIDKTEHLETAIILEPENMEEDDFPDVQFIEIYTLEK